MPASQAGRRRFESGRPLLRRHENAAGYEIAGATMCPGDFSLGTSGAHLTEWYSCATARRSPGGVGTHRLGVASRRLSKQARVFATELRRACIAHLVRDRLRTRAAGQQATARLLQPQLFLVLNGADPGDRAEVRVQR